MLAVCGGGGSDATAWAVVAGAIVLWAFVAALVIRAGRDGGERLLLASLLAFSGLIGLLVYLGIGDGPTGHGRFILALLIPGVIGGGLALLTRTAHGIRAFFISSWGALFATGALYILLIAFFPLGNGCLD